MSPNVGLSYIPDFSENADYYGFGGISLRQGGKQANLSFGLDQKWQLKLGRGKAERKLNDLFTLGSRVSANLYKDENKFGKISHSLAFRPGSFNLGNFQNNDFKLDGLKLSYSAQLNLSQNTYRIQLGDPAIESQYFSHSIGLSGSALYNDYFPPPKNRSFQSFGNQQHVDEAPTSETNTGWSIGINHDLLAPKSLLHPRTQNLRMNASFDLTKNYSVTYNNYYDLKKKQLISQGFRVSRDLHCWKLDITFNKRNEYWDYRIVFSNTQFPDALKFETRDSKRY